MSSVPGPDRETLALLGYILAYHVTVLGQGHWTVSPEIESG